MIFDTHKESFYFGANQMKKPRRFETHLLSSERGDTTPLVGATKNASSPSSVSSPMLLEISAAGFARVGARVLARLGRDLTRCWS